MVYLKRISSIGLIIKLILLASLMPVSALAASPESLVNVTSATTLFNPAKQSASINYTVIGPDAAQGLYIKIYKAAPTSGLRRCNDLASHYISTIAGPENKPVGSYSASWTGKAPNGASYEAGLYCYKLHWDNPPLFSEPLIEGLITLANYPVNSDGTGGTGGSGTGGGTGGGSGTGGTGSGTGTASTDLISATVDPPGIVTINKQTGERSSAYIRYKINQTLPYGYTLAIYSGETRIIILHGIINQSVPATTGYVLKEWNGTRTDGKDADPGIYTYRFTVPNKIDPVAAGFITVQHIGTTVTTPQADIVHYADPMVFDPKAASPNNKTTIRYTVNRALGSGTLNLSIRDVNNSTVRLDTVPSTVGSHEFTWNGTYLNGTVVPVGEYKYVFVWNGNQIEQPGRVYVQYSTTQTQPPLGQFLVGTPYANPSIFTPSMGQTTAIYYTLGKNVTNFRISIRNQNQTIVQDIANFSSKNAGSDAAVWNGYFGTARAEPGIYTFAIEAANESPFYGNVTVASQQQNSSLVITDLFPNPSSFSYGGGSTNFQYQVNQNARINIRIFSGTTVVRRLLNNNASANAINYVPWDGRDENGVFTAANTYNYTIEDANGVAQAKTGYITITSSNTGCQYGTCLDVTNLYADPNPFNPDTQGQTQLKFTLNYTANVTVTVSRSDGTNVKTVTTNQTYNSGTNYVYWNGTDSNNNIVVSQGSSATFNFTVYATSSQYGSDSATSSLTVSRNPTSGSSVDVYDVNADPNPFYPNTQYETRIRFSLNRAAFVTIYITRQDGTQIKTLVSNKLYSAGTNISESWNGTNQDNQMVVADGSSAVFNYRVDASYPSYNSDYATGTLTVNRGDNVTSEFYITDSGASPNPFNPRNGQTTQISFGVSKWPSTLTVRIYRSGTFVRELSVTNTSSSGSYYYYRAEWNGKDYSGNYVDNNSYTYRIDAYWQGKSASREGSVSVGSGTYVSSGNCGNFKDVEKDYYLCPAIEFVKSRGIFAGYSDGTIGLNRVIQRAELLAVIQKAFKYPLDSYSSSSDGDLGYADLENRTNHWYMPYLKTFSRLKLMVGYPDKKMRPERTMNTAELYLVFLKAAKASPQNIAHFSLENHELIKFQPFKDVPTSAKWYLKYAGFAKLNDLVKTERFYPARGITRGQVIELVYNTHIKGLITYGPATVASN